jgi:hypothetical protein
MSQGGLLVAAWTTAFAVDDKAMLLAVRLFEPGATVVHALVGIYVHELSTGLAIWHSIHRRLVKVL